MGNWVQGASLRNGIESGASASMPITSTHPLDDEDVSEHRHDHDHEPDAWDRWSSEDKAAVEEAERFDDISVVGVLYEEQELGGCMRGNLV